MQLAAAEDQKGHPRLAEQLRQGAEASRAPSKPTPAKPTPLAAPRGDLAGFLDASYPSARLNDVILPFHIEDEISLIVTETRLPEGATGDDEVSRSPAVCPHPRRTGRAWKASRSSWPECENRGAVGHRSPELRCELETAWKNGETQPTHRRPYRRTKPWPKRPSMYEPFETMAEGRPRTLGSRSAATAEGNRSSSLRSKEYQNGATAGEDLAHRNGGLVILDGSWIKSLPISGSDTSTVAAQPLVTLIGAGGQFLTSPDILGRGRRVCSDDNRRRMTLT